MSIEINNESGAEVDELALTRLGRFVLDALGVSPLVCCTTFCVVGS